MKVGSAEKHAIFDCLLFRARPNVPTFGTGAASSKKIDYIFRDWQNAVGNLPTAFCQLNLTP
jgi:hypothetical protein